jgi:YidC/Oxa1 family membrane protein insertase
MAANKMDWQKPLLIAAMCAVVFMLILRWSDFQDAQLAQQPQITSTAPDTVFVPEELADDIPTLPETDVPADEAQPVIQPTASRQHVRVQTDSLDLLIDPHGGDIIHVALPRHYASLRTPDIAFVLLTSNEFHTYVAQSGLVGPDGTDTREGRPVFFAERTHYQMQDGQDTLVVDLTYQQGLVGITKRFTFARGEYLIDVQYLIDNQSANPWRGNLYGQIKRDSMEPVATGGAIGMSPYLGAAVTTDDDKYRKVSFRDMNRDAFRTIKEGGWVAMVQHYFVSAWVPDQQSVNNFHLRRMGGQDMYLLGFTAPRTEVAPQSQGTISAQFYAGPKDTARLAQISPYLDLTVDYGWLWWLAKPLFWLLAWIHGFVGNWGIAIIVLTIIIKAAFFQLSATSYRSMAKMRKLSPKMAELKERYGDDRQKMSKELMDLYKKEKVNPLGGCLPILVQMPVFLALYWVLMESVELRHAPFFGWIVDLSVKDPFFILPLLMGLTMFIQFKLNPTPPDPTQARIMQMMPIVFTFLFLCSRRGWCCTG